MKNEFNLSSLGNWLHSWVQPDGSIYGFHNHSVWGDNPMRWQDYTCGHSTFAAPYMVGLAMLLSQQYNVKAHTELELIIRYQSQSMRTDGEYKHIGFQTGELAKVGLIHNMVPCLSLGLSVYYGKAFLSTDTIALAKKSMEISLDKGSLHYANGRADKTACCNQDYARIWAKLAYQQAFSETKYQQEIIEDLDFMIENFHISNVPTYGCDGTIRSLLNSDNTMLEPAEYYGLMIAPLCLAYKMFKLDRFLAAAKRLSYHVIKSSFIDERGCRRIHRAYYTKTNGTWGQLKSPMQIQGNGLTLYGINLCGMLCDNIEMKKFSQEMVNTMIGYQTERGFTCPATGWDTEADVIPASAWQAHDFMYFASIMNIQDDFWDKYFAIKDELSIVLSNNCMWFENGEKWSLQDYFSRSVYQVFGRKDNNKFGRDFAWTGECGVVDETYRWENIPRLVLQGDTIAPLKKLPKNTKIYNFSKYFYCDYNE